jgi:hypothetical protein
MKKILIIWLLVFLLSSCLLDKKTENDVKVLNKKVENESMKYNTYDIETQKIINNQMEKWPQVILNIDCEKKYKQIDTIKYCKEEQSRVKQLFNIK